MTIKLQGFALAWALPSAGEDINMLRMTICAPNGFLIHESSHYLCSLLYLESMRSFALIPQLHRNRRPALG
ncbi:hypothetical protein F5879DRAFT_943079 [Lentinula edodes]|nr:hypothetical protein F5879DRAFT_943079 [Lentinula edodes]